MKLLNNLFLELDADSSGTVSAEELRSALRDSWPEERVGKLIKGLVGDDDGEVSYEAFMGQLISVMEPAEDELLCSIFSELDPEGKGFLDLAAFQMLLARPTLAQMLGSRNPAALLRELD